MKFSITLLFGVMTVFALMTLPVFNTSTWAGQSSSQKVEENNNTIDKKESEKRESDNVSLSLPTLTPATSQKLAVRVKMQSGEVFVAAFAEDLSKQTGLTIAVAPYLRERKVIVQCTEATAMDLLIAIAEMNDWMIRELRETPQESPSQKGKGAAGKSQPGKVADKKELASAESGSILIVHRTLRVPQEATFIPRLIQNAFPRDLREYLNIQRPSDDRHAYKDPEHVDKSDFDIKNFERDGMFENRFFMSDARSLIAFRATLSIDKLEKEQLPYAKLTEDQKRLLLEYNIFNAIFASRTLLKGDFSRRFLDPGNYTIHWDEKAGTFHGPGFGAHIETLRKP